MIARTISIYHGSKGIIESPELSLGNPHNDFGRGFYCTEFIDLAKEWACDETRGGYANKYSLDMTGLKVLDLTSKKYSIFHWLSVLLQNRYFPAYSDLGLEAQKYIKEKFPVDTTGYDIIIGYRADDTHFSIAKDFLQNKLSVKELKKMLATDKEGKQIALVSEKAFDHLTFVGYEVAPMDINYPLKRMRDEKDRMRYFLKKDNEFTTMAIFVFDLVRKGSTLNDSRI